MIKIVKEKISNIKKTTFEVAKPIGIGPMKNMKPPSTFFFSVLKIKLKNKSKIPIKIKIKPTQNKLSIRKFLNSRIN
jgi:hypothetical protein